MADKKIKVTLVRSPIGALKNHKACLTGLGLKRIRHAVELEDTPAIRGMINRVNHLVEVSEA